ncbi:MAG: acyl transferase [Schleiferiaceae bacterium]|nr:acyl transferase [Schleiferiaceae bacterium]
MLSDRFPFIDESFEKLALTIFQYQAENNQVFNSWLNSLNWDTNKIKSTNNISEIPFLPVSAFKTHKVVTGDFIPEVVYTSSGAIDSKHLVSSKKLYLKNAQLSFEKFYGPAKNYAWLCLLPGYLERDGSSLIDMAEYFISISEHDESGFFIKGIDELKYRLDTLELNGIPTILLGVTFALLDLTETLSPMKLGHTIIMETGGMKGRRKEPIRNEIHKKLTSFFGVKKIHSEYGMTELLSQAYSFGDGLFRPPPQMNVIPRSLETPLINSELNEVSGLNIIDLANSDSCAFIATDDIGKVFENGCFEVIGRIDGSDKRGCSLLSI